MNWETTQSIDVFRKARLFSGLNKKDRDPELRNKPNGNRDNFDKTGTILLVFVGLYIVMSAVVTS